MPPPQDGEETGWNPVFSVHGWVCGAQVCRGSKEGPGEEGVWGWPAPPGWVFRRVWGRVYLGLRAPTQLPRPQSPPATTGLLYPGPQGQLRLEGVCTRHEGCVSLPWTPRAGSGPPPVWSSLSAQGWAAECPWGLTTPLEPRILRLQETLPAVPGTPGGPLLKPTAGSGKQELD